MPKKYDNSYNSLVRISQKIIALKTIEEFDIPLGVPMKEIFTHLEETGKLTHHLNKQIVNSALAKQQIPKYSVTFTPSTDAALTGKRQHVTLPEQGKHKCRSSPKRRPHLPTKK